MNTPKPPQIPKEHERLDTHNKSHPTIAHSSASGLLIGAASLGAPLILGAVGFSAVGPIAGSAAAAWQSSMGLVQAGSLFTWCQSAAMGGAAVGGIVAAGSVGVGAAAAATLAGLVTKTTLGHMTEEKVRNMYGNAFRKGPPLPPVAEPQEGNRKRETKIENRGR